MPRTFELSSELFHHLEQQIEFGDYPPVVRRSLASFRDSVERHCVSVVDACSMDGIFIVDEVLPGAVYDALALNPQPALF